MRQIILLGLALSCLACSKPAWLRMPDLSAPDFSSWFFEENVVPVHEVARANVCATQDQDSRISLFPSLAGMQAWAASRGIALVSTRGEIFPESPYAVVEHGQRPHGGFGIAVSVQGGLLNDTLVLKATYFEPRQGRWASDSTTSPCVVVSLPARQYEEVKLIDQNGEVRAETSGRGT